MSLPLEPGYKVISCFQAFAFSNSQLVPLYNLARRVAGAKPSRKPPRDYGTDRAVAGGGGGGGSGGGAGGSRVTPVCGIVVGPFRGADMCRPEDFVRYHAQPQRVVPLTAQLLGACGYLMKKDAREAASR